MLIIITGAATGQTHTISQETDLEHKDMPFIHYEALVQDDTGKTRDFNISWPVSREIVEALQSAIDDTGRKSVISDTGMENAKDVIGKALLGSQPYIFEAAPWTCKCGRRATMIHHSPLIHEGKIKLGIVVDKPEMICDNPACKQRALRSKLAEHKEGKKRTAPGYKLSYVYNCAGCNKTGGRHNNMKKCHRCLLAWCSTHECQKAHKEACRKEDP